jgi:aspartate aminotransferase
MERVQQVVSHFASVPLEPPDAIFGLSANYKKDTDPNKVDLVVGAYRTDEGKPWILPVVSKVEKMVVQEVTDHEYLPIDGLPEFTNAASALLLGKDSPILKEKRFAATQGLSGSGSLRIGAEFLSRHYNLSKTIYIPNPTWANHRNLFGDAGLTVKDYRYFDKKTIGLDLAGMLEDLRNAPNGSIILLHVCAHNPTGIDPTKEQWKQIATVIQEKEHLTYFDCAYQGFATGDLDEDAFSIRLFAQMNLEFLCAQSFAKNMGLYGERIGNLLIVTKTAEIAENVKSQTKRIVRGMISNSPSYGARICAKILNTPEYFAEWDQNIKVMANRIKLMRKTLYDALKEKNTPGNWEHILNQIGMFTFTGLTTKQCEALMNEHHVYLTTNGRISMPGLTTKNIHYVAEKIHLVVTTVN